MSQEVITNNKLTDPTSSVLKVSEFHIQSKCYKVWSRKLEYWDPKTRSKHANWIHTTFKNQRPIIFCILITTFYNHRLAPKNKTLNKEKREKILWIYLQFWCMTCQDWRLSITESANHIHCWLLFFFFFFDGTFYCYLNISILHLSLPTIYMQSLLTPAISGCRN